MAPYIPLPSIIIIIIIYPASESCIHTYTTTTLLLPYPLAAWLNLYWSEQERVRLLGPGACCEECAGGASGVRAKGGGQRECRMEQSSFLLQLWDERGEGEGYTTRLMCCHAASRGTNNPVRRTFAPLPAWYP